MSDIKIVPVKCVNGSCLYQKLFLVFMLCFSMNSYSWPSLKIDHENSTKDRAVVHIVENGTVLNTRIIKAKKIYVLRQFKKCTQQKGDLKIFHSVFVEQPADTISCILIKKEKGKEGWLFSDEVKDTRQIDLKDINFSTFYRQYKGSLKGHFRENSDLVNSKLYKGFFTAVSKELTLEGRTFYDFHAVLDVWPADDQLHIGIWDPENQAVDQLNQAVDQFNQAVDQLIIDTWDPENPRGFDVRTSNNESAFGVWQP